MNINFKHFTFAKTVLLCLLTLSSGARAAPNDQQSLKRDIEQLSDTLDSTKDQYQQLSSEVTQLEKKLGDIASNYRQTELKIDSAKKRLQDTNTQSETLDRDLDVQKAALAEQLQAMYTAGGQSHLRLLLRQDDPSDISRTLKYFEYLNDHRMQRIKRLHQTREDIENLRTTANREQLQLNELGATLEQQQQQLQSTLNARETKLSAIKGDMRTQERQLTKLKEDEASLLRKLERLAEKREQTSLTQSQLPAKPIEPTPAAVIEQKRAEITESIMPPTNPKHAQAEADTVSYSQLRPFTQLKGRLSWPTSGRILHAYRSRRNEKQQWSGVVIKANGGAAVRSIAAGKVAFAGWMDGYGHLIIIEHDRHYLSLYGYNRAIYKREGQAIKANEVIAAVGNSGGQRQDGLYFEIRKGTTPMNPAIWCR
ncbi:MAG: hypothetical protein RLZZ422_230 [Pseudomonadota bacterium]